MPSTTRATITNVSRRYFSKPWPVAPDSHLASFFRIAPNPPAPRSRRWALILELRYDQHIKEGLDGRNSTRFLDGCRWYGRE